ncbi:hypothetical protein SAMN02745130_02716 [Thiothrix eikelboomii]|uniref:Uncharacterized protein n=1 Tax=Thiothrix eikelboomii TaxID=92487 RepID=A0A1T4XBX9_9GAMM|nr:hypothetical protein SAMN02745130_02716 [Thiothrix eikelboomii]
MNSRNEKALIAGNNQGSKSNTLNLNYTATALFFHLSFADFPTSALIKVEVKHAS